MKQTANINNLITNNIDVWTTAIKSKSRTGRGSNKTYELYGIKKLRALILDLAVRGLLVPQNPNDEPASELLKKIAEEKELLLKNKKIKKPKKLLPISDDEKFIKIPKNWDFVRLNDLGEWGAGATPSRRNPEYFGGQIPWFKSGELNNDYISKSEEHVTDLALKKSSLRYNKVGDVLFAMYGATIGKTSILKVRATTNQAVCACTPFNGFNNTYLLTLLKAYKSRFINMGAGGAQPNISREKIVATVIALPPTKEQKRIVAKVDELMALCDQLVQQTDTSIKAHKLLVENLLNALTQAKDHKTFHEAWQRIVQHFDTLFTTEHSIDQLKQTILQLAVMGKLVPQNPNDEPASELLKKIAKEKEKLIKQGKIKKQKPLPEISEEEKPFGLPRGWEWVRLQDITNLITDGKHGDCRNQSLSGYYFLSAKNIQNGNLNYDNARQIIQKDFEEVHNRTNLEPFDICMVNTGATVGKIAIATVNKYTRYTTFQKSVAVIKVTKPYINVFYLTNFLISETPNLLKKSGGSAINNLLLGDIKKKLFYLPPLEEQNRIVAKVDKLMALCDQLNSKITSSKTIQSIIADTLTQL